jgi:hypothetical protein
VLPVEVAVLALSVGLVVVLGWGAWSALQRSARRRRRRGGRGNSDLGRFEAELR